MGGGDGGPCLQGVGSRDPGSAPSMPPLGGLPTSLPNMLPPLGVGPLGVPNPLGALGPTGAPPPAAGTAAMPMGLPPVPGGSPADEQLKAMLVYQNPELASHFTRQAAEQYEQVVSSGIDPEIMEMACHFNLDDRSTRALDQQMKTRKKSFTEDMEALWEILGGARNPSGLLMVKVREMQEGVFRGFSTPEKDVADFARKWKLDAHASAKLAEVLAKRNDPKEDMIKLAKHLERSNKPSALMMLMLKDLRMGKAVPEPTHAAAMGSAAHRRELEDQKKKDERRRNRSRSREHQRHRSRSRSRDRDREKDRRRDSRSRPSRRR